MSELERPSNIDAEKYVLGACMLSSTAAAETAEMLPAADMYLPKHEIIYAAIRALLDRDEPTDVIAVADELIKAGDAERAGGVDYLHVLTGAVPTWKNVGYYAEKVRDAAMRRHAIDAAYRAVQKALDMTVSAEDAVELAREAFEGIDTDTVQGVEAIGDWFTDYALSLNEKPSYTPTPWHDLNGLIFGLRDGGMYVIGARPGDGKSIMAVQIARHFARHRPVLFVSLEMKREEIAARAISAAAQIFIGSLNKHQLTDSEWREFAKHQEHLKSLPLVIVDSAEVATVPQLKAKVRAVSRRFKQNPVVIVDYLQLLTSPTKQESRQVEVAGFSRALKLAAQQWNVPVVALSQLNRGGANRKGKAAEPQLHDLRESGSLEQDADLVMLLHRKPVPGARDELKVIVAKSRQGQTGEVSLTWEGQFSRVIDKTVEHLVDERGRM